MVRTSSAEEVLQGAAEVAYTELSYKKTLRTMVKKNKLLAALSFVFVIGMLYGAAMVGSSDGMNDRLEFITQGFINERTGESLIGIFGVSLQSSASLLVLLFFSGFFAIGQPIALATPFFRGLGLGMSMGYLYANFGGRGMLFSLALIFPHALISSITLIFAAKESMRFSLGFLSRISPGNNTAMLPVRAYVMRFVLMFMFLMAAAFSDAVFTRMFAGMFTGS
ncbi:MAG: hypothetical protein FWH14_08640 [Oscillospiraceae bacterium]|nr:hypothetical protein [Oscillospiraceae bacterium]